MLAQPSPVSVNSRGAACCAIAAALLIVAIACTQSRPQPDPATQPPLLNGKKVQKVIIGPVDRKDDPGPDIGIPGAYPRNR